MYVYVCKHTQINLLTGYNLYFFATEFVHFSQYCPINRGSYDTFLIANRRTAYCGIVWEHMRIHKKNDQMLTASCRNSILRYNILEKSKENGGQRFVHLIQSRRGL